MLFGTWKVLGWPSISTEIRYWVCRLLPSAQSDTNTSLRRRAKSRVLQICKNDQESGQSDFTQKAIRPNVFPFNLGRPCEIAARKGRDLRRRPQREFQCVRAREGGARPLNRLGEINDHMDMESSGAGPYEEGTSMARRTRSLSAAMKVGESPTAGIMR